MKPRIEIAQTPLAEHGGRFGALSGASERPLLADFSVCLNAYGPAPVVREAIRNSAIDEYPDRFCTTPRRVASARWHRPMEEIVFGAGTAELIQAVCFAYLNRGDAVVIARPCFAEYERAARLCGAAVHALTTPIGSDEVSLLSGAHALLDTVSSTNARLLFVASPTSPTGGQYPTHLLQLLADTCRQRDCLLVLDQSYDAFSAHPAGTPALPGHSHVVHLRSLTKDHALAGVRAGYAVTAPSIAAHMERARVPWSASNAAQAAATAALSDEAMPHVSRTTTQLRENAAAIATHVTQLGLEVVASTTHYLLINIGPADAMCARLLGEHGILVRNCTSFSLPNFIRVAARQPHENHLLLRAFDAICAQASPVRSVPPAPPTTPTQP